MSARRLPDRDGYETTTILREREQIRGEPPIPIIAVTAFALAGDKRRCLAAGMDAYLAKPVDLNILRKTIQQVMDKRDR